MKSPWLAASAMAACLCVPHPAVAQQSDEAVVIAVAHAAADAFREGDISALEELLVSDITVVDPGSRIVSRATILDGIRAGAVKYDVFANREAQARLYGDTAVVVGITEVKGSLFGQPFSAEVRFTDVLVRSLGKWKLVATHATHMPVK